MRVARRSGYPDVWYEREILNHTLMREPDLKQRRKCIRVAAVCATVFAMIFGVALLHSKCMTYGYEISELQTERAELKEANQQLRLEQARLADPQRIDQLARQELGLAPSMPQQVIPLTGPNAQPIPPSTAPIMARNDTALAPVLRGTPREP